jgi:hypothetical protein
MSTPINIDASKLSVPFSLSQFDEKKQEIDAVVISEGLIFEGAQCLYDALLALGIETVKEGDQYDEISVTISSSEAPVKLSLTQQTPIGVSVNTDSNTSILAVNKESSLKVRLEKSNDVDVQAKQKLSVSIINPNEYVSIQPDRTLVLTSENGSKFLVAVGNDGTLAAIPI